MLKCCPPTFTVPCVTVITAELTVNHLRYSPVLLEKPAYRLVGEGISA